MPTRPPTPASASRNTPYSYGRVARLLHWLTAALILITFPLGMIANGLPYDSSEALALKAQVFSVHKTLGVVIFFVALLRIFWALTGEKPRPLHPERRLESFLAEMVHWVLYLALVLVPLSGWSHHAATTGFAPILWPFGQDLPLIHKSASLAEKVGLAHIIFTKILLAGFVLHIAGALKHALIDRDATLARMTKGTAAAGKTAPHPLLPALLATALFAAAGLAAFTLTATDAGKGGAPQFNAASPTAAAEPGAAAAWTVTEGSLTFTVQQMGVAVTGQLPVWQAQIVFDEQTGTGAVTVEIDTTALTLGSVTDQAKAPEFFDSAAHPTARFEAAISPSDTGYAAQGQLTLRGTTLPLILPFQLQVTADQAQMTGQISLDRRDFGMGPSYPDEASVGFAVDVAISLTAQRGG